MLSGEANGVIAPRVKKSGGDNKARSEWMMADYIGNSLDALTTVNRHDWSNKKRQPKMAGVLISNGLAPRNDRIQIRYDEV